MIKSDGMNQASLTKNSLCESGQQNHTLCTQADSRTTRASNVDQGRACTQRCMQLKTVHPADGKAELP